MRNRSWNNLACGAALYAIACAALAQAPVVAPAAKAGAPVVATPAISEENIDVLIDALTCRVSEARYLSLMKLLRRERPEDFSQAYRQYNDPPMDLYRLQMPVNAWGNTGDTIVVSPNRVTMAVDGELEEVTRKLETALEESTQSPLAAALDDKHALVIFQAGQPGLERSVLVGCEYRIEGVSLLDDPEDAWRRPLPAKAASATP
ncbi:MAG: hypothetical protein EOP92_11945 [Lysobacteraceae bacterium]|nr:MAG: hypothetical protein EOP92_11945 [Xanthomonadaceae bacterium]